MTDGFAADAAQIRAHAAKLGAVQDRFGAIKGASASLTADTAAYGMLCGWMSAILEQRHVRQDQLFAYVEENLRLAAAALVATSDDYDRTDGAAADRVRQAGGGR
jgi:hypothetical protein